MKALIYSICSVGLVLATAGLLGAATHALAGKIVGLIFLLSYVGLGAYTGDGLWLFRKPLWRRGKLWVNPFGKLSHEAPPLVWQQRGK